jgi:cytochrome c
MRALGDVAIHMDGFELNKVAGAVLTAMLVIVGSKTAMDIALREHKPEKAGWALPITETTSKAAQPAVAFDAKAVLTQLAKASPDNGRDIFKRCLACHTPDKGGRNLVGPNLWGVVGRKIGAAQGFNYSEAVKNHGSEWTWEELAKYLHSPTETIPGNRMQFPGVKDNQDLADLLAFLRTLSDSPAPLPQ